ncbi:MAG: hypothetical protein J0L99_12165 [Chitinophagales bacterium]|nr:hypothetical protein [Chitinophagales bacterium]
MKTRLLMLLLGLAVNLSAQDSPQTYGALANAASVTQELASVMSGESTRALVVFDNRYEGVRGTPFLFDGWEPGAIQIKKDSLWYARPLKFRFDIYEHELQVRNDSSQTEVIPDNDAFYRFQIQSPEGKQLLFGKYELPGFRHPQFAQVIYQGNKYTLVRHYKKVLKKADLVDKGMVTTGHAYDRFEIMTEYHVRANKQDFQKTALKLKDLKALPNKTGDKKLENYCREHKLKGKLSESQAMQLLAFMDRL